MAFGRKKEEVIEEEFTDPTGWIIDSGIAEVLLMNTIYIKYMCMLVYTYFHGKESNWVSKLCSRVFAA